MKYDVIVVGAGSEGATIATRLTEDPNRSVLLLEAGPDYPNFEHLPDDLKLGNNVWLSAYGPHNWGYVAQVTPQQPNLTIPGARPPAGRARLTVRCSTGAYRLRWPTPAKICVVMSERLGGSHEPHLGTERGYERGGDGQFSEPEVGRPTYLDSS